MLPEVGGVSPTDVDQPAAGTDGSRGIVEDRNLLGAARGLDLVPQERAEHDGVFEAFGGVDGLNLHGFSVGLEAALP